MKTLKTFTLIFGILLAAGGIMSMVFGWVETRVEKKRKDLAALPPGTKLVCCYELQDVGRPAYYQRVVKRWELVKVAEGTRLRWYVLDLDRTKLWPISTCEPIEGLGGERFARRQ